MDLLGDRTGELIAGRYRLDRAIGRGGMGAVYAATHVELGRRVAVKLLLPHFAAEPELLERFRREALAAASLQHANIVQVVDFGYASDRAPFLVMELLEGSSLARLFASQGALPWPRVVAIAVQLLGALSAAHASGIVHRDIKPDNVFLVPLPGVGELVKLLDFGIAKLTGGAAWSRLTETGMVLGTPAYMSPEQMLGERIDPRTDLYAVGAMLYRALGGHVPFRGDHPGAMLQAVLGGTPEPLARLRPDLPPPVVALVERAMARLPAHRFQSADEMLAAMTSLGAQAANTASRTVAHATAAWTTPPVAAPGAPHGPTPPRTRRAWYGTAITLASGMLLGAAVLYSIGFLRPARPQPIASPPSTPLPPSPLPSTPLPSTPLPPSPVVSAATEPAPLAVKPVQVDAASHGPSPHGTSRAQHTNTPAAAAPSAPAGSPTPVDPRAAHAMSWNAPVSFTSGAIQLTVRGFGGTMGYTSPDGLRGPIRSAGQQAAACLARASFDVRALPDAVNTVSTVGPTGVCTGPVLVVPLALPAPVRECLVHAMGSLRLPPPEHCMVGATSQICTTLSVTMHIGQSAP